MSYNIRYKNSNDGKDIWENRQISVAKQIAQCDLVGLQEVVLDQMNDIKQSTPELQWYGVGRNDGKTDGEMAPIGWRTSLFREKEKGTFWLSESPKVVGSKGWDAALPRIASWVLLEAIESGDQFYFLNTHFDHRGKKARVGSARLIRHWIDDHSEFPVIVTGDLNATLTDAPLEALLVKRENGRVVSNARQVSQKKDPGPDSTWNGFRAIQIGRRIDFILVTSDLDVEAFETLDPRTDSNRFASDHLPVTARVSIGN